MGISAVLAFGASVLAAAVPGSVPGDPQAPVFPDWGGSGKGWRTPVPGPGWAAAAVPASADADAGRFENGFRATAVKYFGPPDRGRPASGFKVSAAPGQYVSFAFRLESARDIRCPSPSVSRLTGGRGASLKAEHADVRVVRPLVKRIYQTRTYASIPTLLERRDSVVLGPRRPLTCWVTLYVPPDQPPGGYTGTVFLPGPSGKAWSRPVTLTVHPIRLAEPKRTFQLYYSLSRQDPIHPGTLAREMRDIRSHGINSLAFLATPDLVRKDGEYEVDFSRSIAGEALGLDSLLAAYRAAGFTRPVNYSFCLNQLWHHPEAGWRKPSRDEREFRKGLQALFTAASRRIAAGEWPILQFGLDEPSPRLDEAVKFLEWVREGYPYPSLVNCHGAIHGVDDIGRLAPLAGIISVTRTVPGFRKAMEEVRARGREFRVCNGGGFGSNPLLDRYFFGLDAWRLGADGVSQWNYHQGNDEFWTPDKPYGKIRGDYPTFAFGYPSASGPIPSLGWEAVREGIDDARYLETLEGLLQEGTSNRRARRSSAAVAKAKAWVDSLRASLPIENDERLAYLSGKEEGFLDGIRGRAARLILSVQGRTE